MRIAISGTHASGKSTLITALASALPGYRIVDEPYYALLDEGYTFAAEPTVSDFEAQLERSILSVTGDSNGDTLFDRCPADLCAYLTALSRGTPDMLKDWVSLTTHALKHLDLIVFVPLERPDRIHVTPDEGLRLRKRVDKILGEMLLDDAWGFGIPTLEVRGTPTERAHTVLRHLRRLPLVTFTSRKERGDA